MKKEWTGWLLIAGALMLGLLAFWLMRNYLDAQQEAIRQDLLGDQAKRIQVVVARGDLSPGDVISEATVAVAELPANHVPRLAIKPQDFGQVKGRVIDRAVSAGEMLQADFVSGLIVQRFSGLLSEGERAISVQISSLQSYSGMLLPGDFIDLYVLLPEKKSGNEPRLVPVLERVKVLSAGAQPLRTADQSFQRLDESTSQYNMITVGLQREKAERLALAREAGEIVFFMRNAEDEEIGVVDQDYAFFGDEDTSGGYWYISPMVPGGEHRTLSQADDHNEKNKSLKSSKKFVIPSATDPESDGYTNTISSSPSGDAIIDQQTDRAPHSQHRMQ
ncbi:Flp pilus assembly protein CpaB [Halomonas sp. CH40]